jgi:hypothetical protein
MINLWIYCHVFSDCRRVLDCQLDLLDYKSVTHLQPSLLQLQLTLMASLPSLNSSVDCQLLHCWNCLATGTLELNCWDCWDSKSKSKSHYDRRPVGQCVLVSSPVWGSWPDVNYCLTVTVLSLSGSPSDERSGLSFVLVTWIASVQFSRFAAGPRQHSIFPYL